MLLNIFLRALKSMQIIALILISYSAGNAFSNKSDTTFNTYEIRKLDTVIDLMTHIRLFVDKPPFQKVHEIIDSTFSPYTPQKFYENAADKANKRYWIKANFKNTTKDIKRFYLHFIEIDRLHSYLISDQDQVSEHLKIGHAYKHYSSKINTRPCLLPIELKPGEDLKFMIHLSTANNVIRNKAELEANLIPQGLEAQFHIPKNYFFKGILNIGILFIIAFLLVTSLILYLISKERATIAFTFLCFTTIMYYLRDAEIYFDQPIFWAIWPEMVQKTEVLFRGLITISFLIFTLTFFDLGKWRKLIILSSTCISLFALYAGIRIYFKIDALNHFTATDSFIYLIDLGLVMSNSLFVLFIVWKSKERNSKLFVMGTISYLIISYSGLILGIIIPNIGKTFFSPSLLSLYGIFLFLLFMTYIITLDLYKARKHLETESIRADNLTQLNETRNKLFTNITHELRTPLTIITGLSKKLTDNEKSKKLLINNSEQLLHLTNQILDLSKLESGVIGLENEDLELISFIRVLVDSYKSMANEKLISLNFYSAKKQLLVQADKDKIRKVISNLITNAIKYTPEFGSVMVICEQLDKTIKIAVEDNGKGIAQEKLDQIFNRFYKVDEKTVASTGVGLSIVKELVHLMNGQITTESTLHKGSTFTITLPLILSDQHELAIADDKISYDKAIQEIGIVDSISKGDDQPTILVIEDNQDIRYYIDLVLKDRYKVILVDRGAKGLKLANERTPDIIITDFMMPGMNGIAVCKKIKSNIATSHIPIIMLTAKADKASKLEGLGVGADAYLTKPFDEQELLLTIDNLLTAKKKYQQHYAANVPSVDTSDPENVFIHKIETIIEQHLSDENFTMSQLCELLHLERSQLYRKVKALTGTTPAKMIKERRLDKAHKLLKSQNGNITEITYQCGFKDVSYFSKQFKEAYGKSPSQLLAAK